MKHENIEREFRSLDRNIRCMVSLTDQNIDDIAKRWFPSLNFVFGNRSERIKWLTEEYVRRAAINLKVII